jgi:hypothetical protein
MRADALLLVPAESRGNLCLTLHPSVRLVASNFPVLDIWQANQPGAEADDTIDLDRGGVRLIVWRHAIDVVWRTLPPADHAFIAALAAGQPLGQAFIAACSAAAIANEFQPGPMFADLIASDLLTGFSLAPPEPER